MKKQSKVLVDKFFLQIEEYDIMNRVSARGKKIDKINTVVSNIVLFKDFIGKMFIWNNELRALPFSYSIFTSVYPNLIKFIDEGYYQSHSHPSKEFREYVYSKIKTVEKSKIGNLHALYVYVCIYWCEYIDKIDFSKYSHLPDPYENIVKIFQRGGTIGKVDRTIMINGKYISRKPKYFDYRLPSIEDDFLDFIDEKCGNNDDNVPKQEELNLLWKEYEAIG